MTVIEGARKERRRRKAKDFALGPLSIFPNPFSLSSSSRFRNALLLALIKRREREKERGRLERGQGSFVLYDSVQYCTIVHEN